MAYLNNSDIGEVWIYSRDIQTELDQANQEITRLAILVEQKNGEISDKNTQILLLQKRITDLEAALAECEGTTPPPDPEPAPEVWFNKDFEGVTLVAKSNNTGMNFVGWGLNELTICNASLNFVSGRIDLTPCAIVNDPAGSGRKVLEMRVLDDDPAWSGTSRAQLDLSFDPTIRDQEVIHMSYRKFLHPDIAHMVNIPDFNKTWFTLHEFWYEGASGENPAGGGRVTVYIKEPVEGKLVLRAEMQRTPAPGVQNQLWRQDNQAYDIPFGVWATWDIYLKRGDKNSGQYKLTVTVDGQSPVTVFDIHDTTILPDAPTRRCNYVAPFKLYGGDVLYDAMRAAGKRIQAWYNDFIWYKS